MIKLLNNFIENEMANGDSNLAEEYQNFLDEIQTTNHFDGWTLEELYDHFWSIGFEYRVGRVYRDGKLIDKE